MVLSAFLMPGGYDWHAWRIPGSRAEEIGTFKIIKDIAQQFERAKVDSVFVADAVGGTHLLDNDISMANPYEPVSTLGSLIGVTEHIGLIGTISTTFSQPYTTARQLAGLDILSGGRVGWNIVTSSSGGEAHGIPLPAKEDRYRRAVEFLKVVRGLWGAWSDDALVVNRETGQWIDPSLIKLVEHEGEFFKAHGFINIPRSPQGHPVLIQAGQSSGGLNLGAEVADLIYTVQPERENAMIYYSEQKARIAERGRNPDHVKILPGIIPYVGRTEAEAKDLLNSVVDQMDLQDVRERFQKHYAVKLDDLSLDARIPEERFDVWKTHTAGPRILAYKNYAMEEGRTVRDLLVNHSSAMGHMLVCGSASQVADEMIKWFETRACDGFSLNPPTFPTSINTICDYLIPELQERGYARTEYTGKTLRANLGLPYPAAWDRQ
jgi:FMN-dependent oxidoreductase (nitrilotriacetate monooxygenase family)